MIYRLLLVPAIFFIFYIHCMEETVIVSEFTIDPNATFKKVLEEPIPTEVFKILNLFKNQNETVSHQRLTLAERACLIALQSGTLDETRLPAELIERIKLKFAQHSFVRELRNAKPTVSSLEELPLRPQWKRSANGRHIIAYNDDKTAVYEISQGALRLAYNGPVRFISISEDGEYLLLRKNNEALFLKLSSLTEIPVAEQIDFEKDFEEHAEKNILIELKSDESTQVHKICQQEIHCQLPSAYLFLANKDSYFFNSAAGYKWADYVSLKYNTEWENRDKFLTSIEKTYKYFVQGIQRKLDLESFRSFVENGNTLSFHDWLKKIKERYSEEEIQEIDALEELSEKYPIPASATNYRKIVGNICCFYASYYADKLGDKNASLVMAFKFIGNGEAHAVDRFAKDMLFAGGTKYIYHLQVNDAKSMKCAIWECPNTWEITSIVLNPTGRFALILVNQLDEYHRQRAGELDREDFKQFFKVYLIDLHMHDFVLLLEGRLVGIMGFSQNGSHIFIWSPEKTAGTENTLYYYNIADILRKKTFAELMQKEVKKESSSSPN